MSQTQRANVEKSLSEMPADERAWLEEPLRHYADLLTYLHDH